jgi:hypothetical protein
MTGMTAGRELSRDMMQTAAPPFPAPQRIRALERANAIRLARAGLKRRIATGEISAAEVILACPKEAESWSVGELLISQRRWGSTRCRKFLFHNQILETKPVGKLTERQRRMLATGLDAPDAIQAVVDRPAVPKMALAAV